MTSPSVTYTFTNSTTADATQINQNFTDLINSMTDGTKTFSIDALTAGGSAIFNGNVTLGNASGDSIDVKGSWSTGSTLATISTRGLIEKAAVGTFAATFVQAGGYSQAVTIAYSIVGNSVTMKVPSFLATTTASATIATTTSTLPAGITPTTSSWVIVPVQENGVYTMGIFSINSTGSISLYKDAAATAFTTGRANSGLNANISFSYNIA